jgi:hypothetical protein
MWLGLGTLADGIRLDIMDNVNVVTTGPVTAGSAAE